VPRRGKHRILRPWRWSPLSLFLSTLRLSLTALRCSLRSTLWLPRRLTLGTLAALSSASRFARTRTGRWRAWRFMGARLSALFSASRLVGPCTARWRARLAVALLASLRSATTLTSTGTGWWWCAATFSSETFTAPSLRRVRGATILPGFGGWGKAACLRLALHRRWRRRWSEGLKRRPDRCARGASGRSGLRSSAGSCLLFASLKW